MSETPRLLIKLSPFGQSNEHEFKTHTPALLDWPVDTFIQGGMKGLVVSRSKENPSYTTAFVEAFPGEANGGGFFRGEGSDIAAAEEDCFARYIASVECEPHEWEIRGYKNGGGICKKCNRFAIVFTGEDLKQFCVKCNKPTIYGTVQTDDGEAYTCEEDYRPLLEERFWSLYFKRYSEEWDEKVRKELRMTYFLLGLEAPDWTYDV